MLCILFDIIDMDIIDIVDTIVIIDMHIIDNGYHSSLLIVNDDVGAGRSNSTQSSYSKWVIIAEESKICWKLLVWPVQY